MAGEELRVYACRGDGTLNEAVAGAAGQTHVALPHIPRGCGNDFIRIFTDTAPFRDLDALLTSEKETRFDLITLGGSYSLNACSMGLDARIGAYLLSTLVHVLKGITRHYRVEIDGKVIDGEQTMIFVGNGRWYGGGFLPVPEADPTDGKLDVLLVKKIGRLTVAKFIGLYNEGRYREFPQYVRHYTAGRVKITCDQTGQVNLDGELRLVREVEFCHSPQAAVFSSRNRWCWCAAWSPLLW